MRPLKRLLRAAALLLVCCVVVLGILLVLALQRSPSLPPASPLSAAELTRIEQLLVDSAPGNIRTTELRQLSLSTEELNLLLRYATQLAGGEAAVGSLIRLPGDRLSAEVSVPLPAQFSRLYLNLSADFTSEVDRLTLTSLRVGGLPIPGKLVNSLATLVENHYLERQAPYLEIIALLDSVRQITLTPDRLDLDFMWEPGLLREIRDHAQRFLVSASDQQRIARIYRQLGDIVTGVPTSTQAIPLSTLLVPLFGMAHRQARLGSDPIADNRAILLTVAAYVNGENIEQWLAADLAAELPRARPIEVRVHRRQDLAQHVAASAAIAASAGVGVAQTVSSVKEKYDARYRTGFSFADLTANTSGMLLGTLATHSAQSALEMQRRLSMLGSDADFLPDLGSNPDGLTEADFSTRYRNENSADYQQRVREIESRIAQLPLFSGLDLP